MRSMDFNLQEKWWVKVCGVTRAEDVAACGDAGVSAVGVNFYNKSPRYVSLAAARQWLPEADPRPQRVALFVKEPLEEIRTVCASGLFQAVQLHGEWPPETCRAVRECGLPLIRALALRSMADLEQLSATLADAYILDAWAPDVHGGTGRLSDWGLAIEAIRAFPEKVIILSGGITPANAAQALQEVRPAGLDLASGVESAPGIKDPLLIARLMAAVTSVPVMP